MTKIADSSYPTRSAPDGTEWLHAVDSAHTMDYKLSLLTALKLLWSQVGVWTKNQSVTPVVVSSATGTITPDASSSNNFDYTLTGNITIANPTNLTAGMVLNFRLKQDATGGRTLALGSKFKWPGGTVPTWVTTASATNFFSAYYDSGSDVLLCSGGAGYA